MASALDQHAAHVLRAHVTEADALDYLWQHAPGHMIVHGDAIVRNVRRQKAVIAVRAQHALAVKEYAPWVAFIERLGNGRAADDTTLQWLWVDPERTLTRTVGGFLAHVQSGADAGVYTISHNTRTSASHQLMSYFNVSGKVPLVIYVHCGDARMNADFSLFLEELAAGRLLPPNDRSTEGPIVMTPRRVVCFATYPLTAPGGRELCAQRWRVDELP